MTTREVEFDTLWTLDQNLKYIEKEVLKIRRRTKSVHIREINIDERILSAIYKNYLLLDKCLNRKTGD